MLRNFFFVQLRMAAVCCCPWSFSSKKATTLRRKNLQGFQSQVCLSCWWFYMFFNFHPENWGKCWLLFFQMDWNHQLVIDINIFLSPTFIARQRFENWKTTTSTYHPSSHNHGSGFHQPIWRLFTHFPGPHFPLLWLWEEKNIRLS